MAVSRFVLVVAGLAALAAGPAAAACDDPAWNTAAITAHLGAATPADPAATYDRNTAGGLVVGLAPIADVAFDVAPERAPRNPDPRGAVLRFGAGEPGTYRIALSAKAWIDVVQAGARLRSVAFADFSDCPELHKAVAFDIGPGPFTVQLSDAVEPSIKAAIVAAP